MNKEKQKQTRALFHLFLCWLWIFFRTCIFTFIADIYLFSLLDPSLANVPIPCPPKTPKNHMLSGNPRGHKLKTPPAKLDHLLLTHIRPISLFHIPWRHQKTKILPAFLGGHKTRKSTSKESSDKIKIIEDLLQIKKTNKYIN